MAWELATAASVRLALAESDDVTPRMIASSADRRAETYAYRGYRFTITREVLTWWCHQGAGRPGELLGLCHEAGWGTSLFGHRRIVRRLQRAIDKHERELGRLLETKA